MNEGPLYEKAIKTENFLRQHFIDENNVVYSFLNINSLKPPDESMFIQNLSDMINMDFHVDGYSRSEVAAYENCGMCTSAYMQSLLFRYSIEKNSEMLKSILRCFEALKYIFNKGRQFEEGFFPKIYGNRMSLETSSDQVLYVVTALDHFYKYASEELKPEIDEMITKMVMFWVRRNYIYTYFSRIDMQWPLMRFPPLLLLAYKHSNDGIFKKEYDRLLSEGFTREPEWAQLKKKKQGLIKLSEYEIKRNAFLISNMADCFTMDVMNFDCLLTNDPDNPLRSQWLEGIMTMWNEVKITLASDGKYYSQVLVDMTNGETRRTDGYEKEDTNHGAKSGWSTMVARAAAMSLKYFPDNTGLRDCVKNVLSKIGTNDMTYYDEAERFFPRYRFKTQFLSGDSISNWLWAYWLARGYNAIY